MNYIKVFLAVAFVIAAQLTTASAQSSPEIERLTAEIAKTPKNELLYLERAFLYRWNGKYIGPKVPFEDIGKTIDENRLKALADAEKAIDINPRNYRGFYLRGLVLNNTNGSGSKDFEMAAKVRSESNIVANIYTFDLAGGAIVTPKYNVDLPVLNVIVKGEDLGRIGGFDSLATAKEYSKKNKQPQVIMLHPQTKKLFLYEAYITENIYPNTYLAETPFRKALNGKSKIPLNYETLKIEAAYSVQPLPKIDTIDKFPTEQQVVDIVDAQGLSLLKSPQLQLLRGSKGVRLLFDSELAASNFDEAVAIYNWLAKINAESLDLDVVKITRKTNLSKLYQYAKKLRPFVEKEMTKWKYSEEDKTAVRGIKK